MTRKVKETIVCGYIPRGAHDYLLCEIVDRGDEENAVLIFAGVSRTMEEADAWNAAADK